MPEILQFEFIRNSIIAVILLSITCGIIGSYIVVRRMVFISDAIAHTVFGGIGIAHYFGFNIFAGAFVFGILAMIILELIIRYIKERRDSIIGIMLASGMAIGIIFIYLTPGYSTDLFSYLFGNILLITQNELIHIALLNIILLIFFVVYFNVLRAIAFDNDFAVVLKLPVQNINFAMTIFITIAIILSIKAVGIILVIALLTIPPSIASFFFNDLKKIIITSICLGILFGCCGL
ncbi:MAG TPA: metal ABC transporter permease, partial [bacterium]|nr:metal ABC transporter permease [bacterium]